jgi:hypothetical protein
MLQAIPEASIACVTRFLFQTCRVDQVGTVYEAVATCLHSVDMSGAADTVWNRLDSFATLTPAGSVFL